MKVTLHKDNDFALKILDLILITVEKGVSEAVDIYSKRVIGNWRALSDSSAFPNGPTGTASWRRTKEKYGLHTEDLQRLGRSDSRSYYQNIYFRPLMSGKGWFVGVLDTTPAYNIKFKKDGQFELETANYSLADVAETLEEKYPVWKMLYFENMTFLVDTLAQQIFHQFKILGYEPNRAAI